MRTGELLAQLDYAEQSVELEAENWLQYAEQCVELEAENWRLCSTTLVRGASCGAGS